MHVGEKPYVVLSSATVSALRGPLAWGQVELSSRPLTGDAMTAMLGQMLSEDQRQALADLGAIEEEIEVPGDAGGQFIVTAARGGEDVWVEVRRRKAIPAEPVAADDVDDVTDEPTDSSVAQGIDVSSAIPAVVHADATASTVQLPQTQDSASVTSVTSDPVPDVDVDALAAAFEREAAATLAAREAALAADADAALAARLAELESEVAASLAEKQAALAAHAEAAVAQKE